MAKTSKRVQKSDGPAVEAVSLSSDEDVVDPAYFAVEEDEFHGFDSTDDEDDGAEEPSKAVKNAEKEKIGAIAREAQKGTSEGTRERGVVYIGRLPHGFYEEQIKEYFGQFGTITRLRISRNKKTGASKHYGFIEFANRDVARIVSETMDNYLLFGHLLKVKPMDAAQIHPDLWVGSNRKFQAIPWGRVGSERSNRKHPREWWEAKQQEFDEEREAKARKLADMGIEY